MPCGATGGRSCDFVAWGDSNLFAIDCDAIKKVLAEANAQLLRRRDNLLAALSRAPDFLCSEEAIVRALRFAALLKEATAEARAARISDGRPFQIAAAAIKMRFCGRDVSTCLNTGRTG